MAVGVMALIVVLAVMSGFDAELKHKIVGMQHHLTVQEIGGSNSPEDIIQKIEQLGIHGVISVAPFVEGQAIVRSSSNAIGAVIRGIDDLREPMTDIENYLIGGASNLSDPYVVGEETYPRALIGQGLAAMLGAYVGDTVDIISPYVERQGFLPPKAAAMTFMISGIYAFGMNDFDTALAVIDVKSAQKLYRLESRVTGIGIRLQDVDKSPEIKKMIQAGLGAKYLVGTWIDQNRNFFAALKVEKTVMTIILSLIVLVAAFNIVSSLIMVVMEKTKDIGILRTLGLSAGGVKRIFLMEGIFIGLMGTLFGALAGVVLAMNLNPAADLLERATGIEVFPKDIYYFDKIPAEIQQGDIVVIVIGAFVLAVLASWYPAHRASRLLPVEALRYE